MTGRDQQRCVEVPDEELFRASWTNFGFQGAFEATVESRQGVVVLYNDRKPESFPSMISDFIAKEMSGRSAGRMPLLSVVFSDLLMVLRTSRRCQIVGSLRHIRNCFPHRLRALTWSSRA